MSSPLLSIVIPTHNRARYATHAIASLLELEAGPDVFEIVVHDTSTNDELSSWVTNLLANDARLHYEHSTDDLDLTQNHNRALAIATGTYVCLIGDDDTVLPGLLDLAFYAEAHDIDCVAPHVVANYAWPDFMSQIFGSAHAGRLYMNKRYGVQKSRDTATALASSLDHAAQGTAGLPKLYHGLVKRSVLENIYRKTGAYVHGTSPDVSAAIAIAATVDNFIELDFPVTLPGASGGSNTGASAVGRHKGDVTETRQTARYAANWPSLVPAFYSVETVWAHAALETLQSLGHPAAEKFNYPELYAHCLLKHRNEINLTLQSIKSYHKSRQKSQLTVAVLCARSAAAILFREMARLAKRSLKPTPAGNRRHYDSLETIAQAQVRANRIISTDNKSLIQILKNGNGK